MSGRASGKFILLGEHFIVHGGVPALSFPLKNLWTEVELAPSARKTVSFEGYTVGRDGRRRSVNYLSKAIERAFRHLELTLPLQSLSKEGLIVRSISNFPIGRGFGSSASFALAFARALSQHSREIASQVDEVVHSLERLFHGNPSGVDAATVLSDKPIRFEAGHVVRTITNRAADFVLIDGGERKHCKELVEAVSENRRNDPEAWKTKAAQMSQWANDCEAALERGDTTKVADVVNHVQGVLSGLGLSTPQIEAVISEAKALGALAGKVSGAGAGGAVVVVAQPGTGSEMAEQMKARGFEVLAVEGAQ